MWISKKIVIYVLLSVFLLQNVFLNYVYALNQSNSCVESAINGSCKVSGIGFSYDRKNDCCVCEKPMQNGSCDYAGPGYLDNGKGCCIYSCYVCSAPSKEFQKYINLQINILQHFKNIEIKKEIPTNPKKIEKKPGLFVSKILSISDKILQAWKNMFNKLTKDYKKAYQHIKMYTIITSTIFEETITSISSISILFKARQFVRERSTMQDIDVAIHDTMWDLAKEGYWDNVLSVSDKTSIENTINTNYLFAENNKNGLFNKFYIEGTVEYKDIIYMQQELNIMMKKIMSHMNKDVSSFYNAVKTAEKNIKNKNIVLEINMVFLDNLHNSYMCATNNKCKEITINMNVITSFSRAMETIKNANKNLKEAFPKKNLKEVFSKNKESVDENNKFNLTDKQIELLRVVYGVDTNNIINKEGILFSDIFSLRNGALTNKLISNINVTPLDVFSLENIKLNKNAKKLSDKQNLDQKYIEKLKDTGEFVDQIVDGAQNIEEQSLVSSLLIILDSIVEEKNLTKQSVLLYSTVYTNSYFKEIGGIIHGIIELIGNKDSQGLVNFLGKACSSQCSNNGNTNCYF